MKFQITDRRAKRTPWDSDHILTVDDRPIVESWVVPETSGRWTGGLEIPIELNGSLGKLAKVFEEFRMPIALPWSDLQASVLFRAPHPARHQGWSICIYLTVDTGTWAGPWTIHEYLHSIRTSFEESAPRGVRWPTDDDPLLLVGEPRILFVCAVRQPQTGVLREFRYWVGLLHPVIERARASLSSAVRNDTLLTLFDFPPPIRAACVQYLAYFVQFLRDQGVEADASIRQDDRGVLFSVTPRNGTEALEIIRQALNDFLALPSMQDLGLSAAAHRDIAVIQLEANLYHLKGQLGLALATMRAQDELINVLQLSNAMYRQLTTSQKLLDSGLGQASVDPNSSESLIKGLVDVRPLEGKGFAVNLPELLRRLKRKL